RWHDRISGGDRAPPSGGDPSPAGGKGKTIMAHLPQKPDEGNTVLARSTPFVDSLNAEFYSRYQYPWAPRALDRFTDARFEVSMLNQGIGDWRGGAIPEDPLVWVAGCGTNQAAIAALHIPMARVLGSDLSAKSLQTCANNAEQLGLT